MRDRSREQISELLKPRNASASRLREASRHTLHRIVAGPKTEPSSPVAFVRESLCLRRATTLPPSGCVLSRPDRTRRVRFERSLD